MYYITTLHEIDEWGAKDIRCFGYFYNLDDALKAVKNNTMDMHEYYYSHLVIEKIEQGIHPDAEEISWFEWRDGWKEAKKPKLIEDVVNWSLG